MLRTLKVLGMMLLALLISGRGSSASEIFGSYNNGCIRGASELVETPYLQILRYAPGRAYGHPQLIAFINDLAQKAVASGLPPLLIGDLSKRYGGSFGKASAHGSHQIGLDVDISFDFAKPWRQASELARPRELALVDSKGRPTAYFDNNRVKLILLAASDKRVERIFVAPGIKKRMCELLSSGADAKQWTQSLRRLRPWFGHRAHMHVRLACPKDSPWCEKQISVPAGDGCGAELQSWFEPPKPGDQSSKPIKVRKILPRQCYDVLQGH